jgi:succinyl-CoA synthetase alpha subunit
MRDYGTNVLAGVTPGKGGQSVDEVPVYNTVQEAVLGAGPIDVSVLFVPAPRVRNAALEAIESGIRLLIVIPDRVPVYDVIEMLAIADETGVTVVGPNTLGVLSPGQDLLGMIGGQVASAMEWFKPGPVGITSRSGGITTSIAYYLTRAGIGISTMVNVGGDTIVGLPHPDVLSQFEQDSATKAVVLYGEIGSSQEERVADCIEEGTFTKPLIAYIGGRAARSGIRFSHAGAIIERGRGSYGQKVTRLRQAGAHVVDVLADIPRVTREVLQDLSP